MTTDGVKNFLRKIASNYDPQRTSAPSVSRWFWRHGEGSVFLEGQLARAYDHALNHLLGKFTKAEDIGRRTIERELQTAVFEVLDLPNTRSGNASVRIKAAYANLRKTLNAPRRSIECYVRVGGLDLAELPRRFGEVRFVEFNHTQLNKCRREFSQNPNLTKTNCESVLDKIRDDLWHKGCAITTVKAVDSQAAVYLARIIQERATP